MRVPLTAFAIAPHQMFERLGYRGGCVGRGGNGHKEMKTIC